MTHFHAILIEFRRPFGKGLLVYADTEHGNVCTVLAAVLSKDIANVREYSVGTVAAKDKEEAASLVAQGTWEAESVKGGG